MNAKMYHKEMILKYIFRPFIEAFNGVLDYSLYKLAILLSSIPTLLAFDLFQTPSEWWKGLVWLVVGDWISGVVTAKYRGNFDWNIAAKKWYEATGYLIVCGGAAVVSNSLQDAGGGAFYYIQFVVYATFMLKEFISILRNWRFLTIFTVAWKMLSEKKFSVEGFEEFKDQVTKEFDNKKTGG